MKLSVSLSSDDVALLDDYARTAGLKGRSAVIQRALALLRQEELGDDYAVAWEEWENTGDGSAWDVAAGDGLADASR